MAERQSASAFLHLSAILDGEFRFGESNASAGGGLCV